MDWAACETIAINQTARIRLVLGIILDDLAPQNAEKDFIKGKMVCLSFLISVVSDPYAVMTDSGDDVLNVHHISKKGETERLPGW